jgi:signal recognition particle subunit SRP72
VQRGSVLRLHPVDTDALQTKLFLLLQTEQYDTALSLIADSTSGAGPDYTFEEAYAMYRLHREVEAAPALGKIKGSRRDHRGVLHLEAQLVCTNRTLPTSS